MTQQLTHRQETYLRATNPMVALVYERCNHCGTAVLTDYDTKPVYCSARCHQATTAATLRKLQVRLASVMSAWQDPRLGGGAA